MKRTNKPINKTGAAASPAGNMLAGLSEASAVMNEMFANLETETGSFISRMINGFNDVSKIFDGILRMILGSLRGEEGAGGLFGSLLGFLPGGNMLGGILDLFTGLGSSMLSSHGSGDMNYANASHVSMPNISVIVQSEVENVKAVKFLTNYMPVYNSRTSGSAL